MYGLLRSKHSTDNYSLIHLWDLHVTMTLLILKPNYLCNYKDCSYLQIILNESSWLFSVQQKRNTVQRTVVFTSKNHKGSPKKPSLPKGCTYTVYLFSFNVHICVSNIGAQCTHTCIPTNFWESAFVHDFMEALQHFKNQTYFTDWSTENKDATFWNTKSPYNPS